MQLLFVDESGTPGKPGSCEPQYFVVAGLVIPEGSWHGIRNQIEELKQQNEFHGELKWRYFAPMDNDARNPMLSWNQDKRNDFRKSVFQIITNNNSLRIIAGVCDMPLAYRLWSVKGPEDIYFGTYKVVTERFQYFLQGEEALGIIVADQRNRHQDKIIREKHEQLLNEKGNPYISSYDNFIESIFLSPSEMSIGIQLVDMVAGAIWRFYEKKDDRWLNLIKPSFRKNRKGKIDGYGVARFPKTEDEWTGPIIFS